MGHRCCNFSKESSDHFKGKSAYEHLKEARHKTDQKIGEGHALYSKGPLFNSLNQIKDLATFFALFYVLEIPLLSLFLFCLGFLIWKVCRAAHLTWSRLENLHRVIEEEKHEIVVHREEEKEELREIYRLKGFEGDLLEEIVETLMADDQRLLQVMLEEELGLKLESFHHPILSGIYMFISVFISSLLLLTVTYFIPSLTIATSALLIFISAFIRAKKERLDFIRTIIWNGASFALAVSSVYFFIQIVRSF